MSKTNESSNQRFKRLAELRTNQVLDKLRILGNCSNRQVYKYTREDVEKIISVIEKKVKEVKSQFKYFDTKEEFKL